MDEEHPTPWMKLLDERILDRLDEGSDATAWEISFDLTGTASRDRVEERCGVLANAEFVELREREIVDGRTETVYAITTRGSRYLDREVDANLIRPLPAPRPPHAMRPDWWAGFG